MDPSIFLPEFHQEMGNTRRALSRIPDDGYDLRPHPKSWSMSELAGHIANVPNWLTMTLGSEELDLAQPMEPPPVPSGTEDLLVRFDEAVARARAALVAASPEELAGTWTLRAGDEVMFSMPRAAVIRSMILNHMIHHRGQLTVYLRLAGAPVPGLYGPSADDGA